MTSADTSRHTGTNISPISPALFTDSQHRLMRVRRGYDAYLRDQAGTHPANFGWQPLDGCLVWVAIDSIRDGLATVSYPDGPTMVTSHIPTRYLKPISILAALRGEVAWWHYER